MGILKRIENLHSKEWRGITVTVIALVTTVFLVSYASRFNDILVAAISCGALGGIVHEVARSNGRFVLPKADHDTYYLGGLFGLISGGVAGLLLAQGFTGEHVTRSLLVETFLAGLALKGFAEAAATRRPNKG
jgi:hypothetical protein